MGGFSCIFIKLDLIEGLFPSPLAFYSGDCRILVPHSMETKAPVRFTLGKQSSLAPERLRDELEGLTEIEGGEEVDDGVRLMYLANEGDLEGMKDILDSGVDVNFKDIDDRTALHIAACQGYADAVALLIERKATVDCRDRWGSTVRSMPPQISCFCDGFFLCMRFNGLVVYVSCVNIRRVCECLLAIGVYDCVPSLFFFFLFCHYLGPSSSNLFFMY